MPNYPETVVAPMREELVRAGFTQLTTPEDVDAALDRPGKTLLVLNSVCGCAAGSLRPGVVKAVTERELVFDHLVTVFAGMETKAVEQVRKRFGNTAASSPNIAIFRDGHLVLHLPRRVFENLDAEAVANELEQACSQG
jgi:putative YphP/YqiW family bacilliredoxin